ncbi:LptF/LptG family permease [Tuwongella immobilis]|uniref:Permease YjgP/YjgQ family protein n=1 Tax=Tuwongella immobilis TaxID=692036 RepID=A0A6C2YIC3_9BACT|nr:LptF/LptG family permease [Tuwongella immobilis]VIP00742.1 permease family protein : Putative permease OS=Singulisphaera acidiphila (strain ATCC BAA-1392 / DSM 18658 / VKM B-2454 / MOB10) GN=Sinac_2241 PE=4 SV=1: YjgP_YjgQ [Tuwongella immobilis]VTR96902.1 permease family protein : Putative permease OS=Singulisphaera acidiphila (strain ATCC BAA-1392 / DSM 18658 / VKM B-2454 / MOB10) GN=Sinac_2241 PE=4 SV=1: YjgP_YjgQ [Tuwongella immobilis]
MLLNILQRTILMELIKVFVLALLGLTGLFLIAGLIQEASQRGLSPSQILAAIPLLIPNTLPYTIPATTLFATCVVYGRLSADNEVTAIKAAGVNPIMLLKPALLLGIGTSVVTATLYYSVIPQTHQIMRTRFLSDGEEVIYNVLKRERRLVFPNFPYAMFVREIQGRRLIDVIFKRRVKMGGIYVGYDLVAQAREARLRVDQENNIIHIDMDRCSVFESDKDVVGNLLHRSFPIPLPETLFGKDDRPKPMALTIPELRIEQVKQATILNDLTREMANAQKEAQRPDNTPERANEIKLHLSNLDNRLKDQKRVISGLATELNARPAIAFGCLCFVLIGCPVGIWASRSDYLSSFVSCFLPIIFVYYPLLLSATNLAREGKAPAVGTLWIPNAVLFLASLFLIRRMIRR